MVRRAGKYKKRCGVCAGAGGRCLRNSYLLSLLLLLGTCMAARSENKGPVRTGADRMEAVVPLLQGKRVGLVVNQTSVLSDGHTHLLDTLLACGIRVDRVFAPEHGFRGTADAGEEVADSRDLRTGIPIISVYGKNKKPSADQLDGLDALVFDIQDVGARFFTYISTMHYIMEACTENGKELVVLDRPNPNDFVDGPVLEPALRSFIGMHPIPVLHGLTVGELARMINGEGWMACTPDTCRLTVVELENWKHGDPYWLPVKPSPNLPNDQAVRLYPSLCFFEATDISIGRGTYFPFQVIGYPDKRYGDFTFTPVSLAGFDKRPVQQDKTCYGVDLRECPFEGGLTLRFLLDFYEKSGEGKAFFFSRPQFFDRLAGTKKLRWQLVKGLSEDEIRASWTEDLDRYREMREKYLLY